MPFDEPVLPDNYPVNYDYCYVVDGNVVHSNIKGTIADLKRELKAKEIRRCDLVGRNAASMAFR